VDLCSETGRSFSSFITCFTLVTNNENLQAKFDVTWQPQKSFADILFGYLCKSNNFGINFICVQKFTFLFAIVEVPWNMQEIQSIRELLVFGGETLHSHCI